jgi:hypothetical protein
LIPFDVAISEAKQPTTWSLGKLCIATVFWIIKNVFSCLKSGEVVKMGIMFNRAFDVLVLKWGRGAGGSSGTEQPWRPQLPLPPPTHFSEAYCIPSSRKRVSLLYFKYSQECERGNKFTEETL